MKIGNRVLNENEAEWAVNHAKDVLAKATSGLRDGLNIAVTENEVASLLNDVWNNNTNLTYEDIESEVNTSDADTPIGEDDD